MDACVITPASPLIGSAGVSTIGTEHVELCLRVPALFR
jgi:hypothetical protein